MMDKEKIIESVDHLVNPLDNAINEKCSRIKKVFLSLMDEYSASYYIISSHTQKAPRRTRATRDDRLGAVCHAHGQTIQTYTL